MFVLFKSIGCLVINCNNISSNFISVGVSGVDESIYFSGWSSIWWLFNHV